MAAVAIWWAVAADASSTREMGQLGREGVAMVQGAAARVAEWAGVREVLLEEVAAAAAVVVARVGLQPLGSRPLPRARHPRSKIQ